MEAIEELIWNALDSGGNQVDVQLDRNALGGVGSIRVRDFGQGIAPSQLEQAFGEIGNSMKPALKVNADGRVLHGCEGKGRLKALALCRRPRWRTAYRVGQQTFAYSVDIDRDEPEFFDPTEPDLVPGGMTGTTVVLDNVDERSDSLLRDDVRDILTHRFALYLAEYPITQIVFDGKPLDVSKAIAHKEDIDLEMGEGKPTAKVTVIEWRFKPDRRLLYLCDESGFAYAELPFKIPAPGLDFTAYFRSDIVKTWDETGLLGAGELHPSIQQALDLARGKIRDHIRTRLAETAQETVAEWKELDIYPYEEDESKNPVVAAEQQVFDIIATHVDSLHPSFHGTDDESKRLTLTLMRKALESNPSALLSVLEGYTEMSAEEQAELAELLGRTTFSAIIKAGSIVAQRLDTLMAFEHLLFAKEWRAKLLERTQLHRLLMHELWIIGEQYLVATDDEGLKDVLKKHLKILGREDLAEEVEDVSTITGKEGIPDVMLWNRRKVDSSHFEHLVIELKRPSQPLGKTELMQIRDYAYTVIDDERFNTSKVSWKFVLLGNDLDRFATRDMQSSNLPPGCIKDDNNVQIWVLRWADVISDARERYEFFRDKLALQASSTKGLELLKTRYSHLMSGRGVRKKRDLAISSARSSENMPAGSEGAEVPSPGKSPNSSKRRKVAKTGNNPA